MKGRYSGISSKARKAIESGEKPYEKYTKDEIIDYLTKKCIDYEKVSLLDCLSENVLKNICLSKSKYHHCGRKFEKVFFYYIDDAKIRLLSVHELKDICGLGVQVDETKIHRCNFSYCEWERDFRGVNVPVRKVLYNVFVKTKGGFHNVYENIDGKAGKFLFRKTKTEKTEVEYLED